MGEYIVGQDIGNGVPYGGSDDFWADPEPVRGELDRLTRATLDRLTPTVPPVPVPPALAGPELHPTRQCGTCGDEHCDACFPVCPVDVMDTPKADGLWFDDQVTMVPVGLSPEMEAVIRQWLSAPPADTESHDTVMVWDSGRVVIMTREEQR